MMDMIEKVARAIAWAELPDDAKAVTTPEDMYIEPRYLDAARAAIEAMREPTEAMLEAAGALSRDYFGGETAELYTDMIDAALTPSPASK